MKLLLDFKEIEIKYTLIIDINDIDLTRRYEYNFSEKVSSNKKKSRYRCRVDDLEFSIVVVKNGLNFNFGLVLDGENAELTVIKEGTVIAKNMKPESFFLSLPIIDYRFIIVNEKHVYMIKSAPFIFTLPQKSKVEKINNEMDNLYNYKLEILYE